MAVTLNNEQEMVAKADAEADAEANAPEAASEALGDAADPAVSTAGLGVVAGVETGADEASEGGSEDVTGPDVPLDAAADQNDPVAEADGALEASDAEDADGGKQ